MLTYWKCRKCHGTGKIITYLRNVEDCPDCDGTGNGMIDGQARAHQREVDQIERENAERQARIDKLRSAL